MKKFLVIISTVLFLFTGVYAQETGDLGPWGGVNSYMGELNQIPFYNPSYSFGVLYTNSFKYRYALRIGIFYDRLMGSSAKSLSPYEQIQNVSFSYGIGEVHLGGEFYFFKFDKNKLKYYFFTPYLLGGVSFLSAPDPYNAFDFAFPIGYGMKFALSKKLTFGMELIYNWTYSDYLDRIPRDTYRIIQHSYNTTTDSYFVMAFYLMFQIFENKPPCPVYTYF